MDYIHEMERAQAVINQKVEVAVEALKIYVGSEESKTGLFGQLHEIKTLTRESAEGTKKVLGEIQAALSTRALEDAKKESKSSAIKGVVDFLTQPWVLVIISWLVYMVSSHQMPGTK
jgi:hypothetical protein